jgi:hypothetical protein
MSKAATKSCIACAEDIKTEALLCKHCNTRQDEPSFRAAEDELDVEVDENYAREILDPISFAQWLAAGRPEIIESYGEAVGFDIPLEDTRSRAGYMLFARWIFSRWDLEVDQVYEDWVHSGQPLVGPKFEIKDFPDERPSHVEEQNSKSIQKYLSPETINFWKDAGEPRIAFDPSSPGEIYFLDWFGFFSWEVLENPIDEDDVLKPLTTAVQEIDDEYEIKELMNKEAFKVWKKRGKPVMVKAFNDLYYKTQRDFQGIFGFEMSLELLDVWYWSGSPPLRGWNYDEAIENYQNAALERQNKAQRWINMVDGFQQFSNGFDEAISSRPSSSTSNSDMGFKPSCVRCGTQLASQFSVCPYCQVTSYGPR